MRNFRLRIFVLICICITSFNIYAKEQLVEVINDNNLIKLKYNFDAPQINTVNGISTVEVKGLEGVGNPGEPLLPVLSSQIVLPQGASVKSFNVVGKAVEVAGEFVIEHAQFAQPLSAFDKSLITPKNTKIYDLKSAYPEQLGYVKNVGKKFGYSILPFNLSPVSYIPADGKISYYKELNVFIELVYDKNAAAGVLAAPPTEEQLNDISAIVDDMSSVKTYTVSDNISKNLTLSPATVDYVFIIPDHFGVVDANRLMKYHRDYNGYSVTNITIEWINSQYAGTRPSGGSDMQTKIREFVYDAYYQWGVRFVMLVGDESLIPSRKMRAVVNYGAYVDDIPADMYFGCLDGTFDGNANGIYGEFDDGVAGGEVDLFAEVYVGRAAVGNSADFKYLVDKIIGYETDAYDDYLREVHMLGEHLGFGGVSEYAKEMMEQIRLGGTYDGYTTLGFADSNFADQYDLDVNLYDFDATWPASSLLSLMNEGSHLFNHLGHANTTYSMKLYNADLDSLTNDKYFFVYSQGCMAGWFDNIGSECFAQKITRLEHGAFGVIMNARYGWGSGNSTDGPSQRFARWFWDYGLGNYDKIMNNGKLLEPGVANQLSKEILAPIINYNCMRWITYQLNLFGDAAAPFRFQEVTSKFMMTRDVVNSTNLFEVGVSDPNLLVSNLTVTVQSYDNFVSLSDRGTLLASVDLDLPFDVASDYFKTNIILADILTPAPVEGNTIVYTYYDEENPYSPATIYYVMTVDNTPPTISDIFVDNVTTSEAQINFSTDEPVTGLILYGSTLPPGLSENVSLSTVVDPVSGLFENHIGLTSLSQETLYYFAIVVEDGAGNVTSIPINVLSTDPDDYNKFVTAGMRMVNSHNFMQDGPLGWTHGGLNDTWAFGEVFGLTEYDWSYDGWQTGLNGPYIRPCNTWLSSPFITSTDINYVILAYELKLAGGSVAYIEGYDGGGWHTLDVIPQSDATLGSFDIRELDTSKPFKLRFRLLSNTGHTAARGLSVFNVDFIEEIIDGIFIKTVTVLDTPDLSPNNNNDGILDAGEIANLQITSINLTQSMIPNVRGTIDLPSPHLSVLGVNTINYGNMDVGAIVTASGYVKVEASPNYNPQAETSYLLQTALSVGTVNSWVDRQKLYVAGNVAEITGKVIDKSGAAVAGATVEIMSESGVFEILTSLGDGTFTSLKKYTIGDEISISADAADFLEKTVTGEVESTNYIELTLGKAYLEVLPSTVNLTVKPKGYSTSSFTVSNVSGDSDLSFDITDYINDQFVITFDADDTTLAQGESTQVNVEVFAKKGFVYNDATIPITIDTFEKSYLTQSGVAASINIDVAFESYDISGIVYDKQGNPLSNIYLISDMLSDWSLTGGDGAYMFSDLAPNTYQFWILDMSDEFLLQEVSSTVLDSDVTMDITLERAYAQIQNAQPIALNLALGQSENVVLDISNTDSSYTADSVTKYALKDLTFNGPGYVDVKFDKTSGIIEPLETDQVLMTVTMPAGGTNSTFTVNVVHTETGQILDTLSVDVILADLDASFLKYVGYEVRDENENNIVELDETFEIFASLKNISPAGVDAESVNGTMSVVSGPATMITNVTYPSACVAGATIIPLTNSLFTVDSGASVGDIITLQFSYTWTDAVGGTQVADAMIFVTVGHVGNIYFVPNAVNTLIYEGDTIPMSVDLVNDLNEQKNFNLTVKFEMGKMIDEETDFVPVKVNWNALDHKKIVPDTLLVRPKDGQSIAKLKLKLITDGYKIKHEYSIIPGLLVETPAGDALSTSAQKIEAWDEVLYVEPEYIRNINRQINTPYRKQSMDPYAYYLWGLYNDGENLETYPGYLVGSDMGTPYEDINAREAWYITTGSKDVKVCVMDSGIYRTHEDLKDNLWINEGEMGLDEFGNDKSTNGIDDDGNGAVDDINGANFLLDIPNGSFSDQNGHGTHVAGTIGAVGNNDIGIVGVNWNVSLVGAQVGDASGRVYASAYWKAIEYCILTDIDIVNMSFGGPGYSSYTYELMRRAGESNVLFICAAGNSGRDNDVPDTAYPASYNLDNIISVAAHDNNGFLAYFSNYGEVSVDISAPGVDIVSTYPGMLPEGSYMNMSGTSMAAPHVTGVAAMLKSIAPDASYELIRKAILDGAVKSHKLTGKVATSGYLNAYDSVILMQTYWIELLTTQANVPANGSQSIDMILNPNKNIVAGEQYKSTVTATEVVSGDEVSLPVTITVMPAIFLQISDVDVAGGDGDGIIDPGETVSLTPYMFNNGSMLLQNGITVDSITFSHPGVTYTGSLTWNSYIHAGEAVASATPISVSFPSTVPSVVTMSVTVTYNEDGRPTQTRVVEYDLQVDTVDIYQVSGSVVDSVLGVNIAGATVQYFGQNTGFVQTDASGNFKITGVANGDLSLKVYKNGYAVSKQITATVAGGNVSGVTFDLVKPTANVTASTQNVKVLKGDQTQVTVTVQNTSNYKWTTPVTLFRKPKLALISDGTQLEGLKTLVEKVGYDCDVLNDNINHAYTLDSGILSKYDVLVLNLTGKNSAGRLLTLGEYGILEDYKLRRGSLIITGTNPFNSPDNYYMSALLNNLVNNGLQEDVKSVGKSYTTTRPVNSVFGAIPSGSRVAVSEKNYDNILVNSAIASVVDHNSAVDNLITVDGATKIAYFDGDAGLGFGNFVWTGNENGLEWSTPSILQDVFKNILLELAELRIVDEAVINGGSGTLNLSSGASYSITLTFKSQNLYDNFSTNNYTLLFANGLEIGNFSKVLDFEVAEEPFRFTAGALGGVTNWLGEALQGDGTEDSAIYQLIYAGADGIPDEPAIDGGTTGDDVIILRSFDRTSFGYFGYGVFAYPNMGRFIDVFAASNLRAGDVVYIRAWDGPSISDSVAYGNSPLYTVQYDVDEQHDFNKWAVGSVINYPGTYGMQPYDLADKNADSIPDGFAVKYGFEAKNPIQALDTGWKSMATTTDGLSKPTSVVVAGSYVYVADAQYNHIAIYDKDLSLIRTYSNPASPFDDPQGIAYDKVNSRLIIADTDNNRIVGLSVQNGTDITWLGAFGSAGDGNGQFNKPYGVTVGTDGRIYVADSSFAGYSDDYHNRISVFEKNGTFVRNIGTIEASAVNGDFNKPLGVTFDDSGFLYVADYANSRIQCMTASGTYLWKLALPQQPKLGAGAMDLKVVSYRYKGALVKKRLFIADYNNNYVLVYGMTTFGNLEYETTLGMYGQQPGSLFHHQGIFMEDGYAGYAYIADTGNGRVQKLEIVLDIDEDGMEDRWEDVYGLDSTVNDALLDPDRDGLYNIGEFRIKTDPMNPDTDGDGVSDGQEVILGTSPWVIDSLGITAVIGGNGSLSFPALAGGIYRLEYTAGLMPINWQNGGTYNAINDGILTIDNLPGWGVYPMMYYRVIWTNPNL